MRVDLNGNAWWHWVIGGVVNGFKFSGGLRNVIIGLGLSLVNVAIEEILEYMKSKISLVSSQKGLIVY